MGNINISAHKNVEKLVTPEFTNVFFDFTEFCAMTLPINGDIDIKLMPKVTDKAGTTGGYNMQTNEITTRFEGRQMADVLRTIAHELVHYNQMERGEFEDGNPVPDIGGYIEDEANAVAGQLIKKFVKEKQARYIYEL